MLKRDYQRTVRLEQARFSGTKCAVIRSARVLSSPIRPIRTGRPRVGKTTSPPTSSVTFQVLKRHLQFFNPVTKKGDSSFISNQRIEGTLDIVWKNFANPVETPGYALHFLRYRGFKNGAQR